MYGNMVCNATATTAQVGMRSDPTGTATNFATRTTTTDWSASTDGAAATSTCTLSNTVYPANGTTFTWTPPAPLDSSYSIGSAGDFISFATALAFLNTNYPLQGIPEGGTIFNVAAGEVFPNTELLPAITATGAPNRPITFRKTGDGANPILQVQGTTATTDAAIKLMGGDYFTFERIDIQNYPSLSSLEYGFQLAAQSYNPCSHNSISYCSITLSRSNSATKAILSAGATSAGNSNNSYLNLGIADCNTGIYLYGNGTAAYHNDGELVSNCVLTDISGQGIEINYSTSVRVTLNQISMCANNNIFMNTSTPGNAGIT
ncbi:MAG TPA: hypothetical protein PLO35_07245, partial [Candidatus Cloacimonadota bacterium]|nr:hypothetical protein [Candidatus Cloacimonadota bacterium]